MKTKITLLSNRLHRFSLLLLAACFLTVPPAGAGLTVNLLMYHTAPGLSAFVNPYAIVASLSTNTTAPAAPLGHYILSSPGTASHSQYDLTSSNFTSFGSSANSYTDFNSFIQQVTNGNWTITVTNNASTNVYAFAVNASSFTSNGFSAPVVVTFPTNNAVNVTNQPTFTWHGPSSWAGSLTVEDYNSDFSFFQSANLPTTQTSWTVPVTLPDGGHTFGVFYISNASPVIVASTPTNINGGTPISGWVSTATLETYQFIPFSVSTPSGGSGGHTLVAHYSFDDGNLSATDVSGNGNGLSSPFSVGGGSAAITTDALAGARAVDFNNNAGAGFAYYYSSNPNLLSALAGSFSVSLWLKTTQVSGSDTDDGTSANAGIMSTYSETVIPMSLTGSKLAFVADDPTQHTLHSATSINTGQYVHVVVTRDQGTGQKRIYINGVLDASNVAGTALINNPVELDIGSQNGHGFNGKMDDIQIYTGVLSASEVSQLHSDPGTTVANTTGGGGLGAALNATNLTWATSGDTSWFVETSNTHDGVSAAQSGIVTNNQTSTLQATVIGPGTLTFWWQTAASDFNFDLEFDIDSTNYVGDIYHNQPWIQKSIVAIPSGQHTLTWTAHAYGSSDPSDAGWVDQVSFTPITFTTVLQSAVFHLTLVNDQSVSTPGGGYWVEPYLFDVQPEPVTVDEIVSPNGKFTYTYTNSITPGALHHDPVNSWAELANECTNGLWTLYVNKDDPSEKQFKFSVTLNGLDTTLLSPVTILTPADGSVNVATNSPVEWSLPNSTNAYIFVAIGNATNNVFYTYMGNDLGLLGATTNWLPSDPNNYGPGGFNYGTNQALIEVFYFSLPAIASITPTNAAFDVISNWTTTGEIETRSSDSFVVGAPAPLPVQLISSPPITSGGDFLLSFQTLAGRLETIQVSTNLPGGWTDVTNFIGDGSVQTFTFPTTNAPGEYFRVITQ